MGVSLWCRGIRVCHSHQLLGQQRQLNSTMDLNLHSDQHGHPRLARWGFW